VPRSCATDSSPSPAKRPTSTISSSSTHPLDIESPFGDDGFGRSAWQVLQGRLHKQHEQESEREDEEDARFTLKELPARLTQHGGLVISGDSVPFEVAVDWPMVEMQLLSSVGRERFVRRKSGFDVRWTVTRIDGPGAGEGASKPQVVTSRGEREALKRSIRLQLGKQETSGTFTVEATIGSNHWRRRTVATKVEVKTEATRMAELLGEANGVGVGALAAEGLVAREHDFHTGSVDDKISKRRDDHGQRFEGEPCKTRSGPARSGCGAGPKRRSPRASAISSRCGCRCRCSP
jgi:hypothetical protein